MPLDLKQLENRVVLVDGMVRARCPACAEKGQDRKGEHLRVYPDGRFGCCVFPRDREHRKRIFALAGERVQHPIHVRAVVAKPAGSVQSGILGRLGRLFAASSRRPAIRDARDGVSKVEVQCQGNPPSGTPGTGSVHSRVYVEQSPSEAADQVCTLKEFRLGVPGVPEWEGAKAPPEGTEKQERMPYFTPDGTLVIPFDSPERYHWWKGGQSVAATRAEVLAQANCPESAPIDPRS